MRIIYVSAIAAADGFLNIGGPAIACVQPLCATRNDSLTGSVGFSSDLLRVKPVMP
jgi:hypothetical protein